MEGNEWVMKQKGISGGRLLKLRPVLCAAVLMAVCLLFPGIAEANYKDPAYRRPSVDRKRSDIILYVGDSRTWFYDLHHIKDRRDGLIYRDGASIGELRYNKNYSRCGQLGKYLRDALKTYPNAKIVLNFGCNGCSRVSRNAKRVVNEYQKWMRAYPDRKFYVASIFPAAGQKPYSRANMHYMNRALKKKWVNHFWCGVNT